MYGGIFSRFIYAEKHILTRIGSVHAHIHALTLTLARDHGAQCQKDLLRQTPHQRLL